MFGIFNSKKKIANTIATVAMNTVRMGFATSGHINKEGVFHPPYGFWEDSYVIGFVYGLSTSSLNFDFSGSSMSTTKKGEIILMIFFNMCGSDCRKAVSISMEGAVSKKDKDFNLGFDHALTLYGASTGRLKENDADPILAQAKSLAAQQHEMNIEISKAFNLPAASTNSSISGAIMELTIMSHIKNKYLQGT